MEKVDVKKIKLVYEDVVGAGKQIKAIIGQPVPCVEFTLRGDVPLTVIQTPKDPVMIAYEPWLQFGPKEWNEMLHEIFSELVNLWNERHQGVPHDDAEKGS